MTHQVKRQYSVADPGEGPGAPLFFDQNEARRAEKIYLEIVPSLSQGLDDRPRPLPPSPPYLKVWIRHW